MIYLSFTVFWKNVKTAHVVVDGVHLKSLEIYESNPLKCPFIHADNGMFIIEYLQSRVLPEYRFDEIMRKASGIKEYNWYEIVRHIHGVSWNDYQWVLFDDEPVKRWEEVRYRP